MLDFRIETFLTVCQTMNFTKAASILNITQPAVSQHIHHLEKEYGIKIFATIGKKLELTAAGKELRGAALTMKHDILFLRKKLEELPFQKKLNFGVTLTVGEYIIPQAIANYLQLHEDVSLHVSVENTQQLLKKLENGEIDFALVEGYFAKNEYDHLAYSTEPYIAVAGVGYPFSKPPIVLEDLFSERILVREPGSGTREVLERHLEERNFQLEEFKYMVEISSISAIKRLAELNCGVAFLYEVAARQEIRNGSLQKIELTDFQVQHDFTFIWRRNSMFSEDYCMLYDQLKNGERL